ncbi:MAG: hypothetical protein R2727_09580 [Bacteroidales bacterium]
MLPHAEYFLREAASWLRITQPGRKYENIFILASSHRASFPGASIYSKVLCYSGKGR